MITEQPRTFNADLTHLPAALLPITLLRRWVIWRWEKRVNKKTGAEEWTKPPYQCVNYREKAKSNDPNTWGTYHEALATVAAGKADGIGFMLKDSEVAAADLDRVRNAATGELVGWAQGLCAEADQLGLYREITVSGAGLRFIGLAQGGELQRKFTFDRATLEGIELYRNTARFITISGLQEGSCEDLPPIDDYLDVLLARYDGKSQSAGLDFNNAGPQFDYYRNLIENGAPEGERSERFQEVVWHEATHITPEQEERYEEDPWEGLVADYLAGLIDPKTTISAVAKCALDFVSNARIGTHDARRIAVVLERVGWKRGTRQKGIRWWVKK